MAHFISKIKSSALNIGWDLLDDELNNFYGYTIDGTTNPSKTGDGHIEGEPSGNAAAEAEYIFCKNIVESFFWQLAEKKIVKAINSTSISLPETKKEAIARSIKNMKSRLILPYFYQWNRLNITENGQTINIPELTLDSNSQVDIRNYLKGNISKSNIVLKKI